MRVFVAALLGDHVDEVLAASESLADVLLNLVSVTPLVEGGEDHLFQHAAGARVAWRHFLRLRSARTSGAGVRSPVQLMRRGAFTNLSVNLSERYSFTIRGVA